MQRLVLTLAGQIDNNADDVMRLIASTIASVPPSSRPWSSRLLLGCWAANYIALCHKYLAEFPIVYIGFSTIYARQFLRVPNVSFNMLQKVLIGPLGGCFLREVKSKGRKMFVWTVNAEDMMRWSIRKEVDGVITDDPKKFLAVCDEYAGVEEEWFGWKTYLDILRIHTMILIYGALFRLKFGVKMDRRWTIDGDDKRR